MQWNTLIITSQYEIEKWCKGNDEEDLAYAFYRRAEVYKTSFETAPQVVSQGPGNTSQGRDAAVQRTIDFFVQSAKKPRGTE